MKRHRAVPSPWATRAKLAALVLVIAGFGGYGWYAYHTYQKGLEKPKAETTAMPGLPSASHMRTMRQEVLNQLHLTDEQRRQLEAIGPLIDPDQLASTGQLPDATDFLARRAASEKVLTPQQAQLARRLIRERIESRFAEVAKRLRPEDAAALRKRMETRMREIGASPQDLQAGPAEARSSS